MATVRPNSSLTDVISILFYKNGQKRKYLLVDCNDLYTLPCSKVLDNWSETADYIEDFIFGKINDNKKMVKIIKVWVPNFPRKHVYHVIYSTEISENAEIKAKTKFRWLSVAEIKEIPNKTKLCSPEIINFTIVNEIFLGENSEPSSEHHLEPWINHNLLCEISEKDILISQTESTPTYLELLKSAEIEISDQRCLYTDFILNCFPYVYMNIYAFMHIVTDVMKWERDDALSLFRSADLHGRGTLSFHDFLFIFAACSRTTAHTGIPAEIRSKYTFRFFDEDSDGLMNYNNFTKLMKYIRIAKKLSIDNASLIQDVQKNAASVGITHSIGMTLLQFVAAVGELKLRGTSTLLRFPKSVKEYLFNIGMNQVKPSTYHIIRTLEESADASVLEDIKPNMSIANSFDISTHTLKIKNSGAFIDIDEIWSQHDWVSPSSSQLLKSSKDKSSIERFNQTSAPNEIINFLKYFSQPSPVDGKLKMSWGNFDMRKVGICMIILSNALISVLESESRLLEITSPVYVMGDLHGNFDDLMHFEEVLWPLSPTLSPTNLLFLGDYVDRGANGLEVVAYLFAYKVHNPNKVFLLRGNHEVRDIQKAFSFYKECIDKFGPQLGVDVWTSINNVFDVMPVAARIDQRVFCCHGGIPPLDLCPSLSLINDIPVVLPLPYDQSQLAWNLMWNDPIRTVDATEEVKLELTSRDGFAYNSRRGTGLCFSSEALNLFLAKHGLSHVIRAHEYQFTGASLFRYCYSNGKTAESDETFKCIQFDGRLLTVFSSSDYCGGRNDSACILLARKKICVFRMASRAS